MIPGAALMASDLEDGQTAETLLPNNSLTVEKNGDSVCFIPAGNGPKACVVVADVCAGKSYVHIIDQVLVPATPSASASAAPTTE